jgi:hypothetical protein
MVGRYGRGVMVNDKPVTADEVFKRETREANVTRTGMLTKR